MAWMFAPAIAREANLWELPRPITKLRWDDTWDRLKFKVPLRLGDQTTGQSLNGAELVIEGQLRRHQAHELRSESERLAVLIALREQLLLGDGGSVSGPDRFEPIEIAPSPFDLVVAVDTETLAQLRWTACTAVRVEWDVSDEHVWTYRLELHADDPRWQLSD
jgi:hypothetical protein